MENKDRKKILKLTRTLTDRLSREFPQVEEYQWTDAISKMLVDVLYTQPLWESLEDDGLYDGVPASREITEAMAGDDLV
ncbi:MAG: hypothetical protein HXL68_13540 [Dechloromonas agitata]|uniref:Uncharacterized protein n=1 Tax=Dechloromonas agitata TaxID=73030 RepID=A0A930G033_9RHOO|nr:hypothetical protein [Dechloromonas agitata]